MRWMWGDLEGKECESNDEKSSGCHRNHHHLPIIHHSRLKNPSIIIFLNFFWAIALSTCPTSTDSAAVKRASKMKLIGKVLQKSRRKFKICNSDLKLIFCILNVHSEAPDAGHGNDDDQAADGRNPKSHPVHRRRLVSLQEDAPLQSNNKTTLQGFYQFILTWSHNSGWKQPHIQMSVEAGERKRVL